MPNTPPLIEEDEDELWFEEPHAAIANRAVSAMIDNNQTNSASTASVTVKSKDTRPIESEQDIMVVRAMVKRVAALLGFSIVNQTKIITAASEIARNTLDYGGGGQFTIELIERREHVGLRLSFKDNGPGIGDIQLAMQDGFTSGRGMGLGLGGSKRLVDEFEIQSDARNGTYVVMTKWI
jgi:serine/threonine-protein kinase RsbT